jgi:hypothetical protein
MHRREPRCATSTPPKVGTARVAARLDDVFAAVRNPPPSSIAVPRDRRAMESDMQEAQINEEGVDLGL